VISDVADELGGDEYITNLHVTDLHIEGPVPEQTCIFKYLKELDLDGGSMTGTIPEFLASCFPEVDNTNINKHNQQRMMYSAKQQMLGPLLIPHS